MNSNIGQVDRWVRIVIGVIALLIVLFSLSSMSTWWWWVSLVVAVIALGTAAINWCPLWAMFGFSTRKKT